MFLFMLLVSGAAAENPLGKVIQLMDDLSARAEAEAEAAPENRSPPERSPPTGSPAPARNPPSAGDLAGPPPAAAPVLPLPDVLLRVAAAGVFLAILRVLARRAGAPGAEL